MRKKIRNLLANPLVISNRRMVGGQYVPDDEAGDPFHYLLATGEEIWVPEELLSLRCFVVALTNKYEVVVTLDMLPGRLRFLDVEEEL